MGDFFKLNYLKVEKKNNLYLIYKITIEFNVNVVTKQTGYECSHIHPSRVFFFGNCSFLFFFINCAY